MKEQDSQQYFRVDTRDAHPHPGTEIWIRARQERQSLWLPAGTRRSATLFSGAPCLPAFNHKDIGQLLGWSAEGFSPVLVECSLTPAYRSDPPTLDELLRLVFRAWETVIVRGSPGAREIVTPAFGPHGYHSGDWQDFLELMGYQPASLVHWHKELRR